MASKGELEKKFQKTRKTSPPKHTKLTNMKKTNRNRNFCTFPSYVSSLLPALGPWAAALPFGPGLFYPNMSSHVKLRVNRAGNKPSPITNPPF